MVCQNKNEFSFNLKASRAKKLRHFRAKYKSTLSWHLTEFVITLGALGSLIVPPFSCEHPRPKYTRGLILGRFPWVFAGSSFVLLFFLRVDINIWRGIRERDRISPRYPAFNSRCHCRHLHKPYISSLT